MKKKKSIVNKELWEDYCFVCKDGGHVRACDFKNCLKAYHPECVGKDPSFLETNESWTCGWHSCSICEKKATVQCYCCPHSVCRSCLQEAEFVQVKKKTKGFCSHCLKLVTLIEENIDVDSDGEKVDFRDIDTYEFLFMEYWEIIKDRDKMALIDFQKTNASLKRGAFTMSGSDSDGLSEVDAGSEFDKSEDNWDDEVSCHKDLKGKYCRTRKPKRNFRSKKIVFTGWGSAELIDFLASIGKDTKEPLELLDVCEIIKNYIHENNLYDPDNKRKKNVICDQSLYALFRKKVVKLYKLYNLLESHFAANAESDDVYSFSSEEGHDIPRQKKQKIASDDKNHKLHPKNCNENTIAPPKSCYASIVGKNISSVYLKKSLVIELLASPDAFEGKVVGCFVRVKLDREDFYFPPEKIYKLGQVIGIKKVLQTYKIGKTSTDIVLCVSDIQKDVQISMLSEDDFEEDECEDLRQLANKGLFRRPTVAELEEKIRSVHTDITNHWIDKEIVRLQRLIDRANEKGWRKELFEYIDKREKLRTSEERQRLLQEIPAVIAQIEENTNGPLDSFIKNKDEAAKEEKKLIGHQECKPLEATEVKISSQVTEIEDDGEAGD
ncbi:hypothetical protein Cni_G24865 [Canna indica]|uniref:Uncharacterized protein n=1 Tax=Canna indica TaxID=4628 RepID=A0AAQ3KW37_9LILI|nr:hypothetical protein Cni_G24865 [Canna indica]